MSISSKVAGTWQPIAKIYAKRSGVWETVKKVYSKQAGVWQQVFTYLGIAWTLRASFSGKRVGYVYYHAANATYYAPVHNADGSAVITLYTSTNLISWTIYGTLAPNTADFGAGRWSNTLSKLVIQWAFSAVNATNSKVYITFKGVWYNANGGAADFGFIAFIIPSIAPPNALDGGFFFTDNAGASFTNDQRFATDGSNTMTVGWRAASQFYPDTMDQSVIVYDFNGVEIISYNKAYLLDSRSAVTYPLKRFTGVAYGVGKWVVVGSYQYTAVVSNLTTNATRLLTLLGSNALHFGGIAFGNGKFVAVSEDGKVITSTDAATWTPPATIATGYVFTGVHYFNGLFVTLSQIGSYPTTFNAWSSADGVSWIKNAMPGTYPEPVNLNIAWNSYPMISGNATKLLASGDGTGIYSG
jgi:hypothetical protein